MKRTKKEKEAIMKQTFDMFCESLDNQYADILAAQTGYSKETIKKFPSLYNDEYATPEEKAKYQKQRENRFAYTAKKIRLRHFQNNQRHQMILDILTDPNNTKEIYQILKEQEITGEEVMEVIRHYTRDFNVSKEKLTIINEALNYYKEAQKNMLNQKVQERKEERQKLADEKDQSNLAFYQNIINYKLEHPGTTTNNLCKKLNINYYQYLKAQEVIEKHDKDLHTKFVAFKNKKIKIEDGKEEKELLDKIIFEIIFHRNSTGKSDFDFFDYYILAQKDLDDIYEIAKRICTPKQKKILIDWMRGTGWNELKSKFAYGKHEISSFSREEKLTGSAKTIIKGHEVTKEENEQLFKIMDEFNMPDHTKLYNQGIRKLLNHELDNYINKKEFVKKI